MDKTTKQSPRILVIGASAAGAFIASRLIEAGQSVALMTGRRRAEQLSLRPLVVRSFSGTFRRRAVVVTADQIDATYDIVVIAARAHLISLAVEQAATAIGADTAVLALSPGGPYASMIKDKTRATVVLDGNFEGRVACDGDGITRHVGPDVRVSIGADLTSPEIAPMFAKLLSSRDMKAVVVGDIIERLAVRNAFDAASIACTMATGLPLADVMRLRHGPRMFGNILRCAPFLVAEGKVVPWEMVERYRSRWHWTSEPIQLPPRTTDRGVAGAEARHLLHAFIETGMRHGFRMPVLSEIAATGRFSPDHVRYSDISLVDPVLEPDPT